MHLEDLLPALDIRIRYLNLAVEPAGSQQCRIEHVRSVGCGEQYDPLVGFESVHFHEQLVESLFPFVVPATVSGTAMAADSIDLVDEDDAGCILFRLVKHVPDPAGADADKHLDEVGSRNREEWHACLSGDCAGEQRLACSRRTDEQCAFGDLSPEARELVWVAQKLDDFFQFLLASSMPATSSKVTRPCLSLSSLALDLPKPIAPRPPPCIRFMMNIQTPIRIRKGNQTDSADAKNDCSWGLAMTSTSAASSLSVMSAPGGMTDWNSVPLDVRM